MTQKRTFGLMNKESLRFAGATGGDFSPRFWAARGKTYQTEDLFYILKFFSNDGYENGHRDVTRSDYVAVEFEKRVTNDNRIEAARIMELPEIQNVNGKSIRYFKDMPEKVQRLYFNGEEIDKGSEDHLMGVVVECPRSVLYKQGDILVIENAVFMDVGLVRKIVPLPETWPTNHTPTNEKDAFLAIVAFGTENVLKQLDTLNPKPADENALSEEVGLRR